MPERKKKRTYTFRKDEPIPYQSGSLIHESVKAERKAVRNISSALEPCKKRK
jgi:hypothetical protein